MGFHADIYVIKKSRSKSYGIEFLNHFLPMREESADSYEIPQYSDNPSCEFKNADNLMTYLENNPLDSHCIYWRNMDDKSPNIHGMIFYTNDDSMVFGISRNTDTNDDLNTSNEDDCLQEMKDYFQTELGYIHYENPPASNYVDFVKIVNELKK